MRSGPGACKVLVILSSSVDLAAAEQSGRRTRLGMLIPYELTCLQSWARAPRGPRAGPGPEQRGGEGRRGGSSLQEEYVQGERFQAGVTSPLQKPMRTEEPQARRQLGDRGTGLGIPTPCRPLPLPAFELVPNLSPCPITVPFKVSLTRLPCTAATSLGPVQLPDDPSQLSVPSLPAQNPSRLPKPCA